MQAIASKAHWKKAPDETICPVLPLLPPGLKRSLSSSTNQSLLIGGRVVLLLLVFILVLPALHQMQVSIFISFSKGGGVSASSPVLEATHTHVYDRFWNNIRMFL